MDLVDLEFFPKFRYLYTLLIVLGLCTASFFLVLPVKAQLTEDFETYTYGNLDGQNGWVTGAGTCARIIFNGVTAFQGNKAIETDCETGNYAVVPFATSTVAIQCFYTRFTDQDDHGNVSFTIKDQNGADYLSILVPDGSDSWTYWADGSYHYGGTINGTLWEQYCIGWTETNGFYSHENFASTTNDGLGQGGSQFQLSQAMETATLYLDWFNDDSATTTGNLDLNEKLYWIFPDEDQEYNMDEFNDWQLMAELEADDIGEYANIIIISSQDADGNEFQEVEDITDLATTTPISISINRTHDFIDGEVYSIAAIMKADWGGATGTYEEIAKTEVIRWYASSTSPNTIFNNPWLKTGFWGVPTSTLESENDFGIISTILNALGRTFPFSLINQLYETFQTIRYNQINYITEKMTLADLFPDSVNDQIPNLDQAVVWENGMLDDNEPWVDYIYPAIQGFIYLVGLIICLMILFPDVRTILPLLRGSGESTAVERGNAKFNQSVIKSQSK